MGKKKKKLLYGSISITSAVILIVTNIGLQTIIDPDRPDDKKINEKLWDIIVPNQYETIQDAIENAKPNDRILVRSGVYKSSPRFLPYPLIIDKENLTICGQDKNSTIITGQGGDTPIYIRADFVNLTGFTIKGNGLNDSLLQVYSDNCIISDNIFITNDFYDGIEYGIVFYQADNNSFFDNNITGADRGLEMRGSNHNMVYKNIFSGNDVGVSIGGILTVDFSRRILSRFYYKPCVNNIFANNMFSANYQGLIADSVRNNHFLNNTFESKGWYGLILSRSTNNVVKNNTFNKNGLELWGRDKEDFIQVVEDNIVNGKPLYYLHKKTNTVVPKDAGQIILVDCYNIRIQRTKISHTTTGIMVAYSTGTKVSYNELSNNDRGIFLFYTVSSTITKNNFIDNGRHASFISLGFINSIRTIWRGNYWDNWLGTRSLLLSLTNKWIFGRIHQRTIIDLMGDLQIGLLTRNVDRRPARRPYSI